MPIPSGDQQVINLSRCVFVKQLLTENQQYHGTVDYEKVDGQVYQRRREQAEETETATAVSSAAYEVRSTIGDRRCVRQNKQK